MQIRWSFKIAYVSLTAPWQKISDSWEDSKQRSRLKENRHKAPWLCAGGLGDEWGLEVSLYFWAIELLLYIYQVYICRFYEKKKFYRNFDISTPCSPLRKKFWDEKIKQMKNTVIVPENCSFGRKWNIYHSPSPTKKDTRNTY